MTNKTPKTDANSADEPKRRKKAPARSKRAEEAKEQKPTRGFGPKRDIELPPGVDPYNPFGP